VSLAEIAVPAQDRSGFRKSADGISIKLYLLTLGEIADFWETHSLSHYWDQTHEVEFEVRAKRRRRVTLAPEVYEYIESYANTQGVLPETLVNL
jgi:hypothetical protein